MLLLPLGAPCHHGYQGEVPPGLRCSWGAQLHAATAAVPRLHGHGSMVLSVAAATPSLHAVPSFTGSCSVLVQLGGSILPCCGCRNLEGHMLLHAPLMHYLWA